MTIVVSFDRSKVWVKMWNK